MQIETIITLLSYLTLIGDLFLLFLLGVFILIRLKNKAALKISKAIGKNSSLFSFVVALIATLGSLFFSESAGFLPCKLCWFQRIFMYPLVIILGISFLRKENISKYVIALAAIGGSISLYHYGLQVYTTLTKVSAVCDATGVSCASDYIFQLGYVTIPMMALTAFLMIIALQLIKKKNS